MNVKKYKLKYDYLKLELEDTREKLKKYTLEWNSRFGKYFEGVPSKHEVWVNQETGEVRSEPPGQEVEPKPKSKNYKDLYRKLSLKTHPDHGGNGEDFTEIKEAYNSDNILELVSYADKYNIDYEFIKEDENYLIESCNKLEEEIKSLQKSLAWSYFTGDKEVKKRCIDQVKRLTGKPINIKDIIDAL